MASNRKLNRPTDQRNAVLRGLVTALIANGRIETTEARAKEVRKIAEKIITTAINECDNTVEVTKRFLTRRSRLWRPHSPMILPPSCMRAVRS